MIKHAAVKTKCGRIFVGKSHSHAFHAIHDAGLESSAKALDQGFLDDKGAYLNREEAFIVAKKNKQLNITGCGGILFSEMLWSPTDKGDHEYTEELGYHRYIVPTGRYRQ